MNLYYENAPQGKAVLIPKDETGSQIVAKEIPASAAVREVNTGGDTFFGFAVSHEVFAKLQAHHKHGADFKFHGRGDLFWQQFAITQEDFFSILKDGDVAKKQAATPFTPEQMKERIGLRETPSRPTPARGEETLDSIVADLSKKDPRLSYSAALRKAQELRPDLARAFVQSLDDIRRANDPPPWQR